MTYAKIIGKPSGSGFIDLVEKLQHSDHHFSLVFNKWDTSETGEDYADSEIIVQGFRDTDEVTLNDLADFLEAIAKQLRK